MKSGSESQKCKQFSDFAQSIHQQSALRRAITEAYRRLEPECVPALIDAAQVDSAQKTQIASTARALIAALRAKQGGSGVEGLIQEYSLSSQEGVALMCLAEALLRIPDDETRDALIRDKVARGDWRAHLDQSKPLFINAATWGLALTGKLTSTVSDGSLGAALTRLIGRAGEPVIRRGVDMAMRMLGEQFVTGQTIAEALQRARNLEARGFRYSYDMLGEAAATAEDARRYFAEYEKAIHAIGKASQGRGVYDGPGISIKLSALHPRYARAQAERVMAELLPRVRMLAVLAKHYDIGFNIDAEEADRLELSLDLLERLSLEPDLGQWNGLGFVVQAYGKRCPFVLDYIIDLARRSKRRIMVRLVKGAYWDAEIKRSQVDGLEGFPVFTRKIYTDISYIACARKLLAAPDAVFPQFATHNAQSLATIYHLAGADFATGKYEFQCLHGMGEPLYDEVVGSGKLNRPCRIYAPVGTHETLLAYLVRRLLENGANTSFVNRIADPKISIDQLIADPVDLARAMPVIGLPHERIAAPCDMFGTERRNSAGLDLSNEIALENLSKALSAAGSVELHAMPLLADAFEGGSIRAVVNPADHQDRVGNVTELPVEQAARVVQSAANAFASWANTTVDKRSTCLERAADLLEQRMPHFMAIAMREAGKTAGNAVGEVREAVDFLRYYAVQARKNFDGATRPLGAVVCISPWNFPLAIFVGQVSAALVAGNSVVAKPSGETPLIAFECVKLLHEAGVPQGALQFAPGGGDVGAALVEAPQTAGVLFTGSTAVARLIQAQLSKRLGAGGKPIPLIAETGGQNAMIVDSSALVEQVVADVVASAFDSAGQRCSALRVLCIQEDIAERTLNMLKGALAELSIGNTGQLKTDIGPVISVPAMNRINAHISRMHSLGHKVHQLPLPETAMRGTFVAPAIIEIGSIAELKNEVFGPVLHVIRFKREQLDDLVDAINSTGYGLTCGLHTRLDETIAHVTSRMKAGNLYVNRNIIGAVVGVQPFGGRGLSGTGPKAGGPLYLRRLVQEAGAAPNESPTEPVVADFAAWLERKGQGPAAALAQKIASHSRLGFKTDLPGPTGERNVYALHPRGRILLMPLTEHGLYHQLAAVLATGNECVVADFDSRVVSEMPQSVRARISSAGGPYAGALLEGEGQQVIEASQKIAALAGPLVLVQAAATDALASGAEAYCLDWLLEEVTTSINTAAAGGNASLMTIG